MSVLLLVGVPLLPGLLALLVLAPALQKPVLRVAPWLPATALALLLLPPEPVSLPWLLLGTRLGVDALAWPLVLLAAVAWSLAGWQARATVPPAEQARFFCFWLLTWCGNLCVFLTLDGASFYAAYAMMTVAAYGLVVHNRRADDFRAGRVYLTMAVLAEGALVAALLLLAVGTGNPDLSQPGAWLAAHDQGSLIAVLMLIGFGVKVGLVGLHMWLPLAHPQAPVPASAVLSGVMLKAGLMGWLRFLPFGESGFEWLGHALFMAGCATALLGVVVGVTQRALKPLLAYSSVSQMGFLAMIVALALLHPASAASHLAVAVLFALHHGLAKSTLFLGVDLVQQAPHLARRLLWLPAAALAGLPPTSGLLVKAALKDTAADASAWQVAAIAAATAATTLLMVRLWAVVRVETRGADRAATTGATPWLASLTASLLLPWAYAATTAGARVTGPALNPGVIVDVVWPLLLGLAIGAGLEVWHRRRPWPEVPAGDLLAWLPRRPPLPPWPRWRLPRVPVGRLPQAAAAMDSVLERLSVALLAGLLVAAALLWL
jgi:formate hydrogenlyase subunit 3/multisubunit Na+/H+ antiporter MnhD subunit